jgi:hypothetical protein
MKCVICGEKTDERILCSKHTGVDACLETMAIHTCGSFKQKAGEMEGTCENYLLCAPIKSALKHEMLVTHGLGHVICPRASTNLSKIIYSDTTEDQIKNNYPECLG